LVDKYGLIAVESLNISGMSKNHRLARAVLDAGWGSFLNILKSKAEWAGVEVVEVNAAYTSQTCPSCGAVAKKILSQRQHVCPCGYTAHRDHAAAQVILARGQVGMPPEGRNVEIALHGLGSR
jgi:putative transposase